jgi:threonyl-tRNA synthetase
MSAETTITLVDGSSRIVPTGTTVAALAGEISKQLAKDAVAAELDGALVDLGSVLPDRATVHILTAGTDKGRHVLRHSTAHVLAQAVLDLWPGAHFAIGPPIADGFYYDFALPGDAHFTDEDLPRIEARMREIVKEAQPFVREEHSVADGLALFSGQPFKREIIEGVAAAAESAATGGEPGEGARERGGGDEELSSEVALGESSVSTYRNTESFVDLCLGPHVPATDRLGHFKLMRVAGAYWRGDEKRPQLQRIYGTAWESASALDGHLQRLEEAERRDHRRLGAELDLFHFPPEIGGGLPVFHPKGGLVRYLIEDFALGMHREHGYELVWTPHLAKSTLFEISGHLEWYAEGMYPPMEMEGANYYPKPMNCPMHILIYKDRSRSYRELPLRLFEFGTVYRFERSGVLHGLTRVRGITQDDSHIFCAPEQLAGELTGLLAFVLDILRAFGLTEFEAELATRPEKFVGEREDWDDATEALRVALEAAEVPYVVAEGEGAFYAPKIDVHLRDAIGRRWQLSTLQVDFQMPDRFDLSYVGADNERHRPRMIHRALLGSVERFFGILLEHYAGALPTWLSPVQARVLPVRDDHEEYARGMVATLRAAGFRADCEEANEPLGARIRRAKLERIPYVLVVGADDVAAGTVGVNERGSEAPQRGVPLETFVERLAADAAHRGAPEASA